MSTLIDHSISMPGAGAHGVLWEDPDRYRTMMLKMRDGDGDPVRMLVIETLKMMLHLDDLDEFENSGTALAILDAIIGDADELHFRMFSTPEIEESRYALQGLLRATNYTIQ